MPVTINSDDPPMFDTTLNQEYEVARELLGLDDEGVADLARTAVRASFADDATRRRSSPRSTPTSSRLRLSHPAVLTAASVWCNL